MKLETVIKGELTKWPYTHPSMPSNVTVDFYGADSIELYNRNLKYTNDWLYSSSPVKYNFNKQCLRMNKDLKQVNDNYIYFSGTSFCMGLGINETDRYSDLIADKLNLDLINCSGPTYSIKAQFISFTNFLNSGYTLPKIFVIEYPPSYAYTFYNKDNYLFYYTKNIPEEHNNHLEAYNNLLETDFFIQEANIYRESIIATCKQLNIKYAEVSFHKNDIFAKDLPLVDIDTNKKDINYCYARDLRVSNGIYSGHPGIGIHKLASDIILKQL